MLSPGLEAVQKRERLPGCRWPTPDLRSSITPSNQMRAALCFDNNPPHVRYGIISVSANDTRQFDYLILIYYHSTTIYSGNRADGKEALLRNI